ncbi:DUF2760 domain-containing protein [Desulfococcaceae bacterium HSG9]|nr:DUF2760 domain-containing protein [Desulfococcaceae bacterium HSG9]
MKLIGSFSRRSLLFILLFMLILLLLSDFAIYLLTDLNTVEDLLSNRLHELIPELADIRTRAHDVFAIFFIPISGGILVLAGLLLWLTLRTSLARFLKRTDEVQEPLQKSTSTTDSQQVSKKAQNRHNRRMMLHLLTVLQRDGRMMDFLAEDLSLYEDAQIGAAVRTVQEDCKKVITKKLAPKPILEEDEGDELTIKTGFDANAYKLTGNVTGEPPFKGIVRHRGWMIKNMELPTLSGDVDPQIMAPAEIEII